jgi:hypothetical protein
MQDQVALGAKRSPSPVKGGIVRAPGSQKRGDEQAASDSYGGAKRLQGLFLARKKVPLTNNTVSKVWVV